jgi:hypothetical protein
MPAIKILALAAGLSFAVIAVAHADTLIRPWTSGRIIVEQVRR